MDFLRRLAPPREGDRSHAVAVLPSRFSGDLPLRSASTPSDAPVIFDDAPAPSSAQTPSPHMHTALPVGPAAADGAHPVASAPVDAPHAWPREPTPPARRHDAGAVAYDELAAKQAQAIAAAPAHAQARPATARPVVAPPVASPLSQGTVAARAHPAESPRPVIHVTIDRIDVRAPAAPSHAAPAKRASAAPR